jgi:hypothetical protein
LGIRRYGQGRRRNQLEGYGRVHGSLMPFGYIGKALHIIIEVGLDLFNRQFGH